MPGAQVDSTSRPGPRKPPPRCAEPGALRPPSSCLKPPLASRPAWNNSGARTGLGLPFQHPSALHSHPSSPLALGTFQARAQRRALAPAAPETGRLFARWRLQPRISSPEAPTGCPRPPNPSPRCCLRALPTLRPASPRAEPGSPLSPRCHPVECLVTEATAPGGGHRWGSFSNHDLRAHDRDKLSDTG